MTCHVGEGIVICTGLTGGWRVSRKVYCPWCCVEGEAPVRGLCVLIFGGYGGAAFVCGECGFEWDFDDGWSPRMDPHDQERRDANVARIAALPDPKCFDCNDTGDLSPYGFEWGRKYREQCPCGAGAPEPGAPKEE